MRVVIQRVSEANVSIKGKIKSQIKEGLLILLGIEDSDTKDDINWLCQKIVNLRVFNDSDGIMNLSVSDVAGELLVVSQFTLHASTKKGNRPSYFRASKSGIAVKMYENFIAQLELEYKKPVKTGEFGADMKIALINDGPVTICIDSKNKE